MQGALGSPRVFIPCFSPAPIASTNREEFEEEGAIVNSLVIRNSSPREIEEERQADGEDD